MADFIISPYAISYNSIKNSLQNFIKNKSDVTKTWKDFYTAGAGETILELDAAVAAFYAFHFIIGRRESFLTVAQNYNSVIGGALSLGYNASRGHNVHVRLNIIPFKTQTLSKWTVVGSYAEYDIVLLKDVILNAGTPTTIDCVIGNSAAQGVSIASTDLQQFVFTAANTTDDCRLLLNDTNNEVPASTSVKDAMDDKYVMLTNPYGSVDVFYLNKGNYKYTTSDTLYLQYIERNNLTFGGLSMSNISIDMADQVEEMTLIEDRQDVEDKEHVRLSAPLYHETNNVVRARKDYVKLLKENNKLLLDANDKDINPGLIALTYLKKQLTEAATSLMTPEEKQAYADFILSVCPDGVAKAFIEDPVRIVRSLAINLWQKANENIPATLEDDIDAILDTYRNKLAPTLDLQQIEHDIEQIPGVKVARVDMGAREYELNTKYKLYDIVNVPKILVGNKYETWQFYCAKVQSQTGKNEPDWAAAASLGSRIIDNNFVWENSNKYAQAVTEHWKKDGKYELYSDINCTYDIKPHCTLATEPYWGELLQKDGNVTWSKVQDFQLPLQERQDDTKYLLSEQVIVRNGDDVAVYVVDEVHRKSGSHAPIWENAENIGETVNDNALTWALRYYNWQAETNYMIASFVGIDINNKLYIYRASGGITGAECPLNGDAVIKDGTNTWTLTDTIENYGTWKASTEIAIGTYVKGNDYYYQIIDTNNHKTGNHITFYDGQWLETVEDNNITFKLDTFNIEDEEIKCVGTKWLPATEFHVGDRIIVKDAFSTYIYQVTYVGDEYITVSDVIYSVVNYAGTTGEYAPYWGADNVEDNDILWTKTNNESNIGWQPNTVKHHGDIITTSEGNYVFSSILGTSDVIQPDWSGIENNQVKDNNITWVRITDAPSMSLQWNEYLHLTADSPKIVG